MKCSVSDRDISRSVFPSATARSVSFPTFGIVITGEILLVSRRVVFAQAYYNVRLVLKVALGQ